MRSMEMSAKTVEAAVQAACEALGVDRDDINVSYEVLEFPTRKLFKTIPAKVLVKVEEPEAEKPAEVSTKPAEVVEISDETAPEIQKEVVEDMVEEAELAPVPGEEVEVPLDIDADPRLQAAVDYLTPIFNLMGVENFTFTAVKKGAATVLKVSGEHMGALIGRRGDDGVPVLPRQPRCEPHGGPLRQAGPGCRRLPQQARGRPLCPCQAHCRPRHPHGMLL